MHPVKIITLDFSQQYLQATLIVSLLSVWVLVGLFAYLNRYTKRDYFSVWTAAWLFYALWLTLSLTTPTAGTASLMFMLRQWCVSISAVFLLWGSLRFLGLPVRQTLFGLFMLFLIVWTFVSPQVFSRNSLEIQLPIFILTGLGSIFAGVCFYRMRKKLPFVGAGMLSLGFLLWGLYLVSYPFTQQKGHENLYSAGFLVAAVLQLFIAVSMIVLVLEEVRLKASEALAEIATVRSEKEQLQTKVLTTEQECRSLYDQVKLTSGIQQAYDELRRTQQMVVQQERLRALGQMASGIAHDVNNALSPVVAYSEMLLKMFPDLPDSGRNYLKTIHTAGKDISRIVANMREFYRRRSDTEQLSKVNVNRVIEEVIELTRPRWRDVAQRNGVQIELKCELGADLPRLLSDASDLREALINLVFNAVDALPQGGIITLATSSAVCPASTARPVREQQLQIEVRDNGLGMDEKTRLHCLEPFFSTKAKHGGTGLGLAMVYGMMQRHGGTIEIDSKPGRGTSVRLTFPVPEASAPAVPVPPAQTGQQRSLRVLCIDDEPHIQELLSNCLGRFDHKVATASGGREGIAMFLAAAKTDQPFQSVITDLGMPDVDGHQVVRAIKAKSPRTPVIMITGWGTMMKEDGDKIPEADALIGKPPSIAKLNELLLQLTAAN
jgi:signal transduction histidine kinase/CheY-like chemotaxis protein